MPQRRFQSQVRRQPVRRNGPALRTVQVLAACIMALSLTGLVAVSVAPSFAARTLEIDGATFTSEAIVRSILGFDASPNLFTIQTDRAAEALSHLPAVQSASVRVRLPSTIVVTLKERQPRLIWAIGGKRYVVDAEGLLFGLVDTAGNPIPSSAGPLSSASPGAESSATSGGSAPAGSASAAGTSAAPEATAAPAADAGDTARPKATARPTPTRPGTKASPTPAARPAASLTAAQASLIPSLAPLPTQDPAESPGPTAVGLPVVFDRRAADAGLALGGIVDSVNLDAGYRLAGLTPADVGSGATSLVVSVDDVHGFTVSSVPAGWVAEFGFYAPTVRADTVIPDQVRDLRSLLLAYGDSHVAWVWLVADVSASHVNTYLRR
jgi:hypothetical protein